MKTAIITGAGSGIGLATAQKFLSEGWTVFAVYHEQHPQFENGFSVCQKIDLTDQGSIIVAAAELGRLAHEIDVLINCAGVLLDGRLIAPDMQKIRATFEVNVFGTIELTERLLPFLVDGAHVINVGSAMGVFATPPYDASALGYRMSKSALHMYTRTLAQRMEMDDRGICVSALHPGWVDTALGRAVADETEQPDRKPEDAAEDLYELATRDDARSGWFWERGKVRDW